MRAKFTRGTDSRLGIRFEPESFEEQLLLEQFANWSTDLEFRFSSWEQNHPGRACREGLTSVWGEFVKKVDPLPVDHEADAAAKTLAVHAAKRSRSKIGIPLGTMLADLRTLVDQLEGSGVTTPASEKALTIARELRFKIESYLLQYAPSEL